MRKRLLRSRSGFEKPESREEAIMQNILGASNVLEPSESNIEEILKSILYNTPYTKEAEFEIEKILLAIKNNGTYDGEGESRDMKILIAILNDLDYTEEAESRIEELYVEWLQQRSQIKVLEGVPPLTFTSSGLPLINYLIEGNTVQNGTPTPDNPVMPEGTGERTGNLFDIDNAIENYYLRNGVPTEYNIGRYVLSDYIPIESDTATISAKTTALTDSGSHWAIYDENKTFIRGGLAFTAKIVPTTKVVDTSGAAFIRVDYALECLTDCMLNLGSTALPYEPYGYKIPVISAGQTNNIYIGSEPLRKAIGVSDVADTITYSTQQLIRRVDSNGYALATPTTETINVPELPTNNGTTVIDVDTTVKPSNIYIEYK